MFVVFATTAAAAAAAATCLVDCSGGFFGAGYC